MAPQWRAPRIQFFGTNIDLLSLEQTVERAEVAMAARKLTRHTALNVAKLIKMRSDPDLADDVNSSDIVGIDGQGIIYGLNLFGLGSLRRVAGIDLFYALLDHCAKTGRRPFLLGASDTNLVRAMAIAAVRYPGLKFAGARNGYFSKADHAQIVEEIALSGADCLFVAMPTPHKERFIKAYASELGVPFVMGIGGSVDVLAGAVSRAPIWMQELGLEWLHRLLKEPRKMAARYARTNSAYAVLLTKALLTRANPITLPEIKTFNDNKEKERVTS